MLLNAGRKWFFPMKRDFIETRGQGMPAGPRRRFGSYHARFRRHFYRAAAQRTIYQANFKLNCGTRLDILRTKKKDPAGADIGSPQRPGLLPPLTGNASNSQR